MCVYVRVCVCTRVRVCMCARVYVDARARTWIICINLVFGYYVMLSFFFTPTTYPFRHKTVNTSVLPCPDSTTTAGRARLECGKTIGPPSATACGPQDFVRRLEFGPRAAHARLPMMCRWLAAYMPTVRSKRNLRWVQHVLASSDRERPED